MCAVPDGTEDHAGRPKPKEEEVTRKLVASLLIAVIGIVPSVQGMIPPNEHEAFAIGELYLVTDDVLRATYAPTGENQEIVMLKEGISYPVQRVFAKRVGRYLRGASYLKTAEHGIRRAHLKVYGVSEDTYLIGLEYRFRKSLVASDGTLTRRVFQIARIVRANEGATITDMRRSAALEAKRMVRVAELRERALLVEGTSSRSVNEGRTVLPKGTPLQDCLRASDEDYSIRVLDCDQDLDKCEVGENARWAACLGVCAVATGGWGLAACLFGCLLFDFLDYQECIDDHRDCLQQAETIRQLCHQICYSTGGNEGN